MARFYQIQLDSLYLTSSGLSNGEPCKMEVLGVENVIRTRAGSTGIAIDGTPVTTLIEQDGKGNVLEIKIAVLYKAVYDSLITLINNAVENFTTINLTGTGDTGNLNLDTVPLMPNPYSFESFRNERIKNFTLRLVTS